MKTSKFNMADANENYNSYKNSKRRRLDEAGKFAVIHKEFISDSRRKLNLSDLPSDILQKIFQWISADFLISNVRVLSKYFEEEVKIHLNTKFCSLYTRLKRAENFALDEIENSKSQKAKNELYTVYNNIKLVVNQYKVVEAAIWRYLKHKNCKFLFCVCGGMMLEFFDEIIIKIYNDINSNFTDIMLQLCGAAKNFTIHFERYKELKLNTDCFVSGAKICDILDCHAFADRKVIHQSYENGICSLKISYKLQYAWFCVLDTDTNEKSVKSKMSWQKEQILMYARMRHLVLAHTGMYLALLDENYIQEHEADPENPDEFMALGCGGQEREYFYYGCYNQAAYNNNVVIYEERFPKDDESCNKFLEIIVDLVCPVEQAPLFIYKQHCMNLERDSRRIVAGRANRRMRKSNFNMEVQFICELSKEAGLPWEYLHVVSDKDRMEKSGKSEKEGDIVYDVFTV